MKITNQFTAAILAIGIAHPVLAQEAGNAILRKRTDANVEQDIKANLAYLRELAEQKQRAEEANRVQSQRNDSAVPTATESKQSKMSPPSPPIYRGGTSPSSLGRSVERLSPEFSWLPKTPHIDTTDLESMQRPSLQTASTATSLGESELSLETSRQVRLANYQDALTAPVLPYGNPGTGFATPGTNTQLNTQTNPIYPPVNGNIGQPLPGTIGGSATVVPNVANPANLPHYPKPQQRPAFVNNEPFVSGAPCQYDAYDMVMPASYNASGYPVCGGPSVFPAAPPIGSMGDAYVPPTLTPNYGPGLYSSNNSGYRPLFSLGQENYNAQLGRGIIGQPTAYVPGQPFRNFFRYLAP